MRIPLLLFVVLLLVTLNVRAASAEGPDLELICPCTLESDGSSTASGQFGIINRGSEATGEIVVRAYAHTEPSFREANLAETEEFLGDFTVSGLAADSQLDLATYQTTVFPPAGQFYVTWLLLDDFTIVDETRSKQKVDFNSDNGYSATSVDFLVDTDGDGVADDNEKFMGTDELSAASRPGASTIEVLAVFNQEALDFYDGDITTRIDHLFAVSNQALADSGVQMRVRVAGYEQLDFDNSLSLDELLDRARAQQGVFADLSALRDSTGADLVAILRDDDGGDFCGYGTLGGYATQGLLGRTDFLTASIIEFNFCGDTTMIHELGHNLGLGHSFRQDESGTFAWSRGHGEDGRFATVMAYGSTYSAPEIPYFSNPDVSECGSLDRPCGVDINQPEPANAALSLEIVRFQAAAFSESRATDTDQDGIPDDVDTDDDNDGMPDDFEIANGLDPLVDDAAGDADGDGISNLQEYSDGTDPRVAGSCGDPDHVAPVPADSALPLEQQILFANPGSNARQQTFLRIINPNDTTANVELYGIDDAGEYSRTEPLSFVLPAQGAKQINGQELEQGNSDKGLSSALCDGRGKWRLVARSDAPLVLMSLIRTPDGFVTGVNTVVPSEGDDHFIYFANPARNTAQQTFLRIVNRSNAAGTVTISGIDDSGTASSGTLSFPLDAFESKQLNGNDLEQGNPGKNVSGALGPGSGKWQLTISSTLELDVFSLIRSPGGFVTNLSGVAPQNGAGDYLLYFVNSGQETAQESFVRVINRSAGTANVSVSAIDDEGQPASGGELQFTLGPRAATQFNAGNLSYGAPEKGLIGALGESSTRWRLQVSADQPIVAMSMIRTPDGFVTNLSEVLEVSGSQDLHFVNPGSNLAQRSLVRIINVSDTQGSITISAFDDQGQASPNGSISFNLGAGRAMELTSQELESGAARFVGSLGDGAGKWRLVISSDVALVVQSLLNAPGGFLTNLTARADSE